MDKIRPVALFTVLVLLCISGIILCYFSYRSIILSQISEGDQFRNPTYHKNIILKIYSDEGTLIYKDWFRWAGTVRDRVFTDTLFAAADALAGQDSVNGILENGFSRYFDIDKSRLNNLIIKDYTSKMVQPDNSTPVDENRFIRYLATKRLLDRYPLKAVYLNYFNNFQFSASIFGTNGAAEYYFGAKFRDLTLREQLHILSVAIHKDAVDQPMSAKRNREIDHVLWGLYESGYIDHDMLEKNIQTPVVFKAPDRVKVEPQLVEAVLNELRRREVDYKNRSYTVYSTLNLRLQRKIRSILKRETDKKDKNLQAAFVLTDFSSGTMRAIVGGKDPADHRNRALNIKRQVGSIFKPLVYLTAFNYGFKPSDRIVDKPYTFKKRGVVYKPKNFEDFFMGKTRIQNGLIYSLNNATVLLAMKVGLSKVSKLAVEMGFAGTRPFMAMPLGSIPFTPFEVASGYTVFGNLGVKKDISVIKKVIDLENGKNVITFNKDKAVVSSKASYQVIQLMQKVVSKGTARGAHLLKGTAGKTGTTNNYKDAWFASLFPPYVGVCWVGYDDYKSMGDKGTGGQLAAPMVAKIQKSILGRGKKIKFDLLKHKQYKKTAKK